MCHPPDVFLFLVRTIGIGIIASALLCAVVFHTAGIDHVHYGEHDADHASSLELSMHMAEKKLFLVPIVVFSVAISVVVSFVCVVLYAVSLYVRLENWRTIVARIERWLIGVLSFTRTYG